LSQLFAGSGIEAYGWENNLRANLQGPLPIPCDFVQFIIKTKGNAQTPDIFDDCSAMLEFFQFDAEPDKSSNQRDKRIVPARNCIAKCHLR
jgi:hypothetical protein